MEYQLATETPLGKTPKKKKIKRNPAAELEPLPGAGSLPASDLYFHFVFSLGTFSISGGSILLLSELSFVCWQLSEYELDREQRVKRNHIMMGELVRATFFLSFKSFGFADCGGLFREFRSCFSSSIQSSQRFSKADKARM